MFLQVRIGQRALFLCILGKLTLDNTIFLWLVLAGMKVLAKHSAGCYESALSKHPAVLYASWGQRSLQTGMTNHHVNLDLSGACHPHSAIQLHLIYWRRVHVDFSWWIQFLWTRFKTHFPDLKKTARCVFKWNKQLHSSTSLSLFK